MHVESAIRQIKSRYRSLAPLMDKRAELDRGIYPVGLKISDAELSGLNLNLAKFHGDWNYSLLPLRKKT